MTLQTISPPRASLGVFAPREEAAGRSEERPILDAFLDRHPDGWCPLARSPHRPTRRAASKEGVRFGVCDCLADPVFLKGVAWREEYSARWERLTDRAAKLHARPEILSPRFHIRTATEWIRGYPFWPIDLESFLALPALRHLPADIALEILRGVARGLALLEEAEILPHDLRSARILLRAPCLRDSNLDRVSAEFLRGTIEVGLADVSDGAAGSGLWSPPEAVEGRPTSWSPIFSWGLLAWNCLTRLPIYKIHEAWVANATDEIWRDRTPHGARLRRSLLPVVYAAATSDEGERRALLTDVLHLSADVEAPAQRLAEALELA